MGPREKVIRGSFALSPTLQLTCALLLSARLWGYGGKGDPLISLKELNPGGIQICSLNEFGLMMYQCSSNFQILRYNIQPSERNLKWHDFSYLNHPSASNIVPCLSCLLMRPATEHFLEKKKKEIYLVLDFIICQEAQMR